MAIGPFSNYEGLLSPSARVEKLRELEEIWFEVADILGTDIIQIPCTFNDGKTNTGDFEQVVRDLREIAELGGVKERRKRGGNEKGRVEKRGYRFAYENLCFGTYNDTWEKAWRVVKAVDKENFGLCLDTFNIAGREWGDPAREDGKVENADRLFKESLKRLVREVDVKKVFYVQVVDAERLTKKLDEKHEFYVEGQKPRMSWSRNCRLFVCEEERGGYLPVLLVLKAICDEKEGLGYKGWVSMELFNRSLVEEGENVPREHARRAVASWGKLVQRMGWEGKVEKLRSDVVTTRSALLEERNEGEVMARL